MEIRHGFLVMTILFSFLTTAFFSPALADSSEIIWLWGDESNHIVNNTGYLFVNGTLETVKYPIYDEPVGLLHDGSPLDMSLGKIPKSKYLEVIYLSTGEVGKGVLGISPMDGKPTSLPQLTANDRIGPVIPVDFGPVVSAVKIYHLESAYSGDSTIIITSTAGNVLAINATVYVETVAGMGENLAPISYEFLWEKHLTDSISQSVAIFYGSSSIGTTSDDRILVVTDEGGVVALSLEGDIVWSTSVEGNGFYSPIAVDAGNMAVIASRDGHIYGLDIRDGTVLWHNKLDAELSTPFMGDYDRSVFHQDALLYVGTSEGYVYGIGIYGDNAGKVVKSVLLKENSPVGDIFVTPDSRILFGGLTVDNNEEQGEIFCLRVAGMEILWRHGVEGAVTKRPVYYGGSGHVFFVTNKGIVYKVTESTGEGIFMANPGLKGTLNTMLAPTIPHGPEELNFKYGAIILTSSDGDMCAFSNNYYNEVRWTDETTAPESNGGGIPGFELSTFLMASAGALGVTRYIGKKRKQS